MDVLKIFSKNFWWCRHIWYRESRYTKCATPEDRSLSDPKFSFLSPSHVIFLCGVTREWNIKKNQFNHINKKNEVFVDTTLLHGASALRLGLSNTTYSGVSKIKKWSCFWVWVLWIESKSKKIVVPCRDNKNLLSLLIPLLRHHSPGQNYFLKHNYFLKQKVSQKLNFFEN